VVVDENGLRAVISRLPEARCSATAPRTPAIPSVCAAALATIGIYESEDIIRRGQDLEQPLYDALPRSRTIRRRASPRGTGFSPRSASTSRRPSPP